MRGELAALIDQSKGHDEIIRRSSPEYGSEEMLGRRSTRVQPPGVAGAVLLGASGAAAIASPP
jgi:hypothetical protein